MTNLTTADLNSIAGPMLAAMAPDVSALDSSRGKSSGPAGLCSAEDVALIQRVREGDSQAFYELIQPYQRAVYSAALSIVKDRDAADDIAQESLLKALRAIGGFRMQCRFSTWLVQITTNEALLWLRKNRHVMVSIDEPVSGDGESEGIAFEVADARPLPSDIVANDELREALREAILDLPVIYREVFVLRDVNHLSIIETAKALDISEEAVKTRLLRARLKMRKALQAFYE